MKALNELRLTKGMNDPQCISPIPKYILHVAKLANQITRTDLSIFNECSEPAPRSTKLYPKSRSTTLGLAKLRKGVIKSFILLGNTIV